MIVNDFLTFHPDGTIRKRKPQVLGHKPHKSHKRKKTAKGVSVQSKSNCLFLATGATAPTSPSVDDASDLESDDSVTDPDFTVEDIDLEDISSDDMSESD